MRVTVRQLKRLIKEAVAEAMDEGPLQLDKPTVLAMLRRDIETQSDELSELNKQIKNGRRVTYKEKNGRVLPVTMISTTPSECVEIVFNQDRSYIFDMYGNLCGDTRW